MKLEAWFKIRNADGTKRRKGEFAIKIGKSPSTVTAYCDGRAMPPIDVAARIERATGGEVTAKDFVLEAAE